MKLGPVELSRLGILGQGVVEFNPQPVPMDPYLLGVLIGDGGLTCVHQGQIRLSSADDEILEQVMAALPTDYYLSHIAGYDYRITRGPNFRGRGVNKSPLIQALKDMGLADLGSHEKFIPDCYLYNTPEVRLSLLQGLLDTDGWVDSSGQARFDQTSPRLAEGVGRLVESLGRIRTPVVPAQQPQGLP